MVATNKYLHKAAIATLGMRCGGYGRRSAVRLIGVKLRCWTVAQTVVTRTPASCWLCIIWKTELLPPSVERRTMDWIRRLTHAFELSNVVSPSHH